MGELEATLEELNHQESEPVSGRLLHRDEKSRKNITDRLQRAMDKEVLETEELNQLAEQRDTTFLSEEDLSAFLLTEFNIKASRSSCYDWARNGITRARGRPTKIDPAMEENILKTALELDRIGMPLTRADIMGLADSIIRSRKSGQAGNSSGVPTQVSVTWYNGFLRRSKAIEPSLCASLVRNQKNNTLLWFNSTNYDWWCDKFGELIQREGFAKRNDDSGELEWITPSRVIIFDETAISGALTQKAAVIKQKGLTIDSRLEKGEKSGKYRRATIDVGTTEEHVTAIMGHTLSFQPIIPIWIICSEKKPKENVLKKIRSAAPKGAELPVRDALGNEIDEVIIGWSPKGGVTQANISSLILKEVELMFPDMQDVEGKRVLIGTDWHNSRFNLEFLTTLRSKGGRLIGWLPNTTSKMQSPDVELFGPFKTLRSKLEKEWVRENQKKVDRYAKIEIAGRAMKQTFTYARIQEGSKKVGLRPINREALREEPAMNDGDVLQTTRCVESGLTTLRQIQQIDPNGENTFEITAESYLEKLKSAKPRIGHLRSLWSPDDEVDEDKAKSRISDAVQRLKQMTGHMDTEKLSQVSAMRSEAEAQAVKLKAKLGEAVKVVEQLKEGIAACESAPDVLIHHRDQQKAHYSAWQSSLEQSLHNLENLDSRRLAAVLIEKVEDVCAVPESALRFGLVNTEQTLGIKNELLKVEGYDLDPLVSLIDEGNRSLMMRSHVTRAGDRRSGVRMTGGSVMFHSNSIEMTGDAIVKMVEGQEEKNRQKRKRKDQAQAEKKRKAEDKLFTLQETAKAKTLELASLNGKTAEQLGSLKVQTARDYVGHIEKYLKFRLEREESQELKGLLSQVGTTKPKKRNEMKLGAIQLAVNVLPNL